MQCLDDCHSYLLETFLKKEPSFNIRFYEIRENGEKIDGTTNEELLEVLIHRLKTLNKKVACKENSSAIIKLEEARMWLKIRTNDRVKRGVEGTNDP